MSVLRSPPLTATGGGSQPDLANLNVDTLNIHNITKRKRKQPECECKYEIQELRKELSGITSLLEKLLENNEQNMSDIKIHIDEIKSTTTTISLEQIRIQKNLTELACTVTDNEKKIKNLEYDLSNLKNIPLNNVVPSSNSYICANEQVIREIQERNIRAKNIVIMGIPEPTAASAPQRRQMDETEVNKIISEIIDEYPQPKIFRLGKYTSDSNRKLKVCFNSQDTAFSILRNKNKLKNEKIKIFADQTPSQQKYFNELREELKRRNQEGESNLTIKYHKGIPKIVSSEAKN